MNSKKTIYNGSRACSEGCGGVITPLESIFGSLCQTCRGARMRSLISNGMVSEKGN